ncbi:VOC family protein [Bacillus pinisoli]|uniref:VOC family protein n=1 Tax=Bacillus pinisoli TaxID=2901866 RepID=UPI001FF53DC8|nr:VOC family protein [Bacillus pinisoli]
MAVLKYSVDFLAELIEVEGRETPVGERVADKGSSLCPYRPRRHGFCRGVGFFTIEKISFIYCPRKASVLERKATIRFTEPYLIKWRIVQMTISSNVSPIKNELSAVFIHVTDLKRAVEWYSTVLGLPYDLTKVESPVYNIPVTSSTGLTLDDHTFDPGYIHQPSPNPIANFKVDHIDEAYQFIRSQNIEIVREIERIGEHFAWFNFKDPDGNVQMACTC